MVWFFGSVWSLIIYPSVGCKLHKFLIQRTYYLLEYIYIIFERKIIKFDRFITALFLKLKEFDNCFCKICFYLSWKKYGYISEYCKCYCFFALSMVPLSFISLLYLSNSLFLFFVFALSFKSYKQNLNIVSQ